MKLNLDQILLDPKGQPFNQNGTTIADVIGSFRNVMQDAPNAPAAEAFAKAVSFLDSALVPLKLGDALYLAVTISPKVREGNASDRRLRGRLAQKLAKNGEQEFDEKEVEALKDDADASLSGLILVAIEDLLETPS